MNLGLYIAICTLLFVIYVEYSVGNILYRVNASGIKSIHITSLLSFMMHPFTDGLLWNLQSLDINYPFVMSCMIIVYFVFNLRELSVDNYHNERPI